MSSFNMEQIHAKFHLTGLTGINNQTVLCFSKFREIIKEASGNDFEISLCLKIKYHKKITMLTP